MVVADMSLAMISVLFNLVVITSIKRRAEIASLTSNLVVLSSPLLCASLNSQSANQRVNAKLYNEILDIYFVNQIRTKILAQLSFERILFCQKSLFYSTIPIILIILIMMEVF